MSGPPGACIPCLRRASLLGILAPFIEAVAGRGGGRRVPQLLALGNDDLLAAVAPTRAAAIAAEVAGLDEATMSVRTTAAGCWAICRHDPGWPPGLNDAADAPAALFGIGSATALSGLETGAAVTVVGARRATGYGRAVARGIGRDLALSGMTAVSGLAYGIDVEVHRGALETGRTIAVLASGADVAYPRGHLPVYRRIRDGDGAVVSEMPPGTAAWRWAFPARNRIMAALAGMTVVVEAAERSGSLITAEMAADLGRDLGAVPGPVTSPVSAGANRLLADGARVVRGAEDILEAMLGPGRRPATDSSLDDAGRVLLAALADGHEDPDSLAAAAGIELDLALQRLLELELQGLVEVDAAGRYRRVR